MDSILKSNLGRRIALLVAVSALLMFTVLAISGWLAVHESSERISLERQALVEATGSYLDYVLRQNLALLASIQFMPEVDITDGDLEPEKKALHSIYFSSIFNDGVFLTDHQGKVIWSEPLRQYFADADISNYPPIQQSLSTGRPVISNVLTMEPNGQKIILTVTPLRSQEGRIVGLVGGTLDPIGRSLHGFPMLVGFGETSHIDVIDSNGLVLASSDLERILQKGQDILGKEQAEITEQIPLTIAPWTVAVSQSESIALAPARSMEQRLIIFGFSALTIALFLGWGLARSLVRPIGQLTTAAQNISHGDLSRPIPNLGNDEVGELSQSFDNMRVTLKNSLEEIRQWNQELEAKVEERTKQLEESYREIQGKEAAHGELLRKLLTVQEEERRRIARELHDETTQSLD